MVSIFVKNWLKDQIALVFQKIKTKLRLKKLEDKLNIFKRKHKSKE